MNERQTELDWGFWVQWLLATAIGFTAGGMLGFASTWSIGEAVTGVLGEPAGAFVAGALFGIFFGAGANAGPALLLRARGLGGNRWLAYSSIAAALSGGAVFAVAFTLFDTMSDPVGAIVMGLTLGIPQGLVQWLHLRGQGLAAGGWPLVSIAAYLLAAGIMMAGGPVDDFIVAVGIAGLVVGAVTGLGMAWVLRRQAEPAAA